MCEQLVAQFSIENELPIYFKDIEKEGLFWISGYVAYTCRNDQDDLGATKDPKNYKQATSTYADLVNRGGLTYPTKDFLKDIKVMYKKFCNCHPENDLNREPMIITQFSKDRATFDHTTTYIKVD